MDKNYSFSARQKKEINKIVNNIPGFSEQGDLGKFFDTYLLCEALARKIIIYKENHKKTQAKNTEYKTLNYTSIRSAKIFFNINITDANIENIFKSGDGKRGYKTPRQLRNAYLHNMSEPDRKEIENNNNYLITKFSRKAHSFRGGM